MKRSMKAICLSVSVLLFCTSCGLTAADTELLEDDSPEVMEDSSDTEFLTDSDDLSGILDILDDSELMGILDDSDITGLLDDSELTGLFDDSDITGILDNFDDTDTEYNIRLAQWANVQWTQYQSPYFTLTVPDGWQVEWQGSTQQLRWQAKAPDGTVGMFNIDHAYAAKDANMMQTLNTSIAMTQGTVEEYFRALFATTTDSFNVVSSCVPANKDQLQALRPNDPIRDYQSLFAEYVENGVEGEGIYSAVVMDSPDVVVRGMNYGLWEINCTFYEWSPRGEFVNWSNVLNTVAKSFTYTDLYYQELMGSMTGGTVSNSVNDPDPVMEAFEERNREDTILQEKRSDMIGEYERVYDNSTGEIYRAYNGFLDDIGSDQSRYSAITDDQYADGYVGWIDK